jgi:hypothetical protein
MGRSVDREGPGNDKWFVGYIGKAVVDAIAAPTHNDSLRRGVVDTAIARLIYFYEQEAEAHGYQPEEPEEQDEEETSERPNVEAWIREYGQVRKFFVDKFGSGVQQIDARAWFTAKMKGKEAEQEAKAGNGAGVKK